MSDLIERLEQHGKDWDITLSTPIDSLVNETWMAYDCLCAARRIATLEAWQREAVPWLQSLAESLEQDGELEYSNDLRGHIARAQAEGMK